MKNGNKSVNNRKLCHKTGIDLNNLNLKYEHIFEKKLKLKIKIKFKSKKHRVDLGKAKKFKIT